MYIDGKRGGTGGKYKFNSKDDFLFPVWAPNQPNVNNGRLTCVKINPYTGMVNINCATKLMALCEIESEFKLN